MSTEELNSSQQTNQPLGSAGSLQQDEQDEELELNLHHKNVKVPDQDQQEEARHQRQATEPGEGDISGGFDQGEESRIDDLQARTVSAQPPILIHSPSQTSTPTQATASRQRHKRIESVPPQRYQLEGADSSGPPLTSIGGLVSSPQLLSPSLEESEGEEDSASSPNAYAYRRRSSATPSETEAAGLDFVDVALDSAGKGGGFSPYGAAMGLEGARSGVDIRADSIASGSQAARAVAEAAKERIALDRRGVVVGARRSGTRRNTASSAAGGTRESMESSSSHGAAAAAAGGVKISRVLDGEGLYRGRRSVNSSRATSPSNSDREERFADTAPPSATSEAVGVQLENGHVATATSMSISTRAAHGLAPIDTSLGMMVASESGELRVVLSPASPASDAAATERNVRRSQGEDEDKEKRMQSVSLEEEVNRSETQEDSDGATTAEEASHTPSTSTAVPASASSNSSTSTANGLTLTDAADAPRKGKHARNASRPSALEQHVSRTRMTTLPPKARDEDVKHLSDFEHMMKSYKATERKRAHEEEERKRRRDTELHESIQVWSQEILPSWTRARREARLRAVWWKGAPPNLRGRVWSLACGNAQMLPRNLHTSALAAARKALEEGTFPQADEEAIEVDIANTLPSLKLYQREIGPLYEDLRDVLRAYVMVRLDQLRDARRNDAEASRAAAEAAATPTSDEASVIPQAYQHGASSLAAMLLSNLTPSETLVALLNLLAERPWLRALYAPAPSGERLTHTNLHASTPATPAFRQDAGAGFERVFDTLLADVLPKVYANMQARGVRPSAYVRDWVRTLFVPFLPFDAVARLWDCILLEEGDALIFRAGLALVKLLSARLYAPDRDELTSILRGNNAAALRVWFRDNAALSPDVTDQRFPSSISSTSALDIPNSAPSDTSARRNVVAPEAWVPRDNIYAQYSITEEQLFEALEEQQEWWRDTTLERLLDRELS